MAHLHSLLTQQRDEPRLLGVQPLPERAAAPHSLTAAAIRLAGSRPIPGSPREAGITSRQGQGEHLLSWGRERDRGHNSTISYPVREGDTSCLRHREHVLLQPRLIYGEQRSIFSLTCWLKHITKQNIELKSSASCFCSPRTHLLKAMGALLGHGISQKMQAWWYRVFFPWFIIFFSSFCSRVELHSKYITWWINLNKILTLASGHSHLISLFSIDYMIMRSLNGRSPKYPVKHKVHLNTFDFVRWC